MLNNQVSIAGQKGNVPRFELSGEPLSCADHCHVAIQSFDVGAALSQGEVQERNCMHGGDDFAASFDQQTIDLMSTVVDLSADPLSLVDVQSEPDILDMDDVDQPSTSGGRQDGANHDSLADAHLQEPAGQITSENQIADASGFDSFAAGGQPVHVAHKGIASCCTHLDDDGHAMPDNQINAAEVVTPHYRDPETIARIKTLYKQRNDIIRAHGNLTRQVTSICYHAVGFNTFLPEKQRAAAMKAGNRLLDDLKSGNPEAAIVFDSAGYLLEVIQQSGFDKQKHAIEKKMAAAVDSLGIGEFIKEVRGFSATQLANIIGEAGDIANYGTVSRLWKRMGLAVIDGVRQSKQTDKGKALDHGYNPSRRSAMWNIGETIIKAQVRNVKNDDGDKTGESIAIGYLGQVYLDRKKDYATRHPDKSKAHIHNDAKRYMEKRLLKTLWKSWNN